MRVTAMGPECDDVGKAVGKALATTFTMQRQTASRARTQDIAEPGRETVL